MQFILVRHAGKFHRLLVQWSVDDRIDNAGLEFLQSDFERRKRVCPARSAHLTQGILIAGRVLDKLDRNLPSAGDFGAPPVNVWVAYDHHLCHIASFRQRKRVSPPTPARSLSDRRAEHRCVVSFA